MLVGEEIHFEAVGDLEGGLLFGGGHHLLRADVRSSLRGRLDGLLSTGQRLDVSIPGDDQRLIGFEVLFQRRHRAEAFAVVLRNAVAIDERPIGRAPAIRPESVLLDDRRTQFGRKHVGFRQPQGTCHRLADLGQSNRREMHAVDGSFAKRRFGQVDIGQAALRGDVGHGGGIGGQILLSLGRGQVRRTVRWHEADGRKEDDARGVARELVQQAIVVGFELGQTCPTLQRLGLTELQDQRGRADRLELTFPRAEIEVAPLLMHGVRFPRHRTEDWSLIRIGHRHALLDLPGLRFADEVLLADEDDDFVLPETELAILERRRSRPTRLRFAEAAEHGLTGRHGHFGHRVDGDVPETDLGLAVAVDLETDEPVGVIDGRIGLGVIQGRFAIEEDRDARPLGPDLILVPLALLLQLGDLGLGLHAIRSDAGSGTGQELLPS